jgi:hypothetical protein
MPRRTALVVLMALQAALLYLSASALAGQGGFLSRLGATLLGLAVFAIPPVIGTLCRTWQGAIALAVAPSWVAVLAHAGTMLGSSIDGFPGPDPFWLLANRPATLLLVLALFALLGALGWLGRRALATELAG